MSHAKVTLLALTLVCGVSCGERNGSTRDDDYGRTTSTQGSQGSTAQQYTCSMHPDVLMNAPGPCPRCGNQLVARK